MVMVAGARITPKTLRYSFDSQIPLSMQRAGKLLAALESKEEAILQFHHGLRGSMRVTLEEGTSAAWLDELLKPYCTEALMSDPRENAVLENVNKSSRAGARNLAEPS